MTGMVSKAEQIIAGLGGVNNIVEIEPCITRLRSEVVNANLVNEAALRAAGVHGVRVTPHVFIQPKELDKLVAALTRYARRTSVGDE